MTHHHDERYEERYERLQSIILDWYATHGREFFWRKKNGDAPEPYITLVSEVMLQQTQTSRVQEKLPAFLAQFPSVHDLARADNATIIKAWQGMGYNSRALRLRDCARAIVERHGGTVPRERDELLSLPGVGAYTASAVGAFAYHDDVAVVDVNIRRMYSRALQTMRTTADVATPEVVSDYAARLIPRGRASDWHQAIMDIGALFCTARAPKCSICPVREVCCSAPTATHTMREETPTKRAEPSFRGIPNRIWRGRVVEMLRGIPNGAALLLDEVITGLFDPSFQRMLFDGTATQNSSKQAAELETEREAGQEEERLWLMRLLEGLEKDRIVMLTRNAQREYTVALFREALHEAFSETLRETDHSLTVKP